MGCTCRFVDDGRKRARARLRPRICDDTASEGSGGGVLDCTWSRNRLEITPWLEHSVLSGGVEFVRLIVTALSSWTKRCRAKRARLPGPKQWRLSQAVRQGRSQQFVCSEAMQASEFKVAFRPRVQPLVTIAVILEVGVVLGAVGIWIGHSHEMAAFTAALVLLHGSAIALWLLYLAWRYLRTTFEINSEGVVRTRNGQIVRACRWADLTTFHCATRRVRIHHTSDPVFELELLAPQDVPKIRDLLREQGFRRFDRVGDHGRMRGVLRSSSSPGRIALDSLSSRVFQPCAAGGRERESRSSFELTLAST